MTKATRQDILALLYDSIADLNEIMPPTSQLAAKEETLLLDGSGGLDSLGMVNLVSTIEDKIQQRYGISITLNDTADVPESDPWRNVGSLADFVTERINSTAA